MSEARAGSRQTQTLGSESQGPGAGAWPIATTTGVERPSLSGLGHVPVLSASELEKYEQGHPAGQSGWMPVALALLAARRASAGASAGPGVLKLFLQASCF